MASCINYLAFFDITGTGSVLQEAGDLDAVYREVSKDHIFSPWHFCELLKKVMQKYIHRSKKYTLENQLY
jgi:hypothetical protein